MLDVTQVPIALAVASAAAYLLARGTLGEAGKDAYAALRQRIQEWIAKEHVDKLEEKPDSAGRQTTLAEELADAGAADDAELRRLAEALRADMERALPAATVVGYFERVRIRGALDMQDNSARGPGASSTVLRDVEIGGDATIKGNRADADGADSAGNG
jgi:aminopeptidase N